MVAAHRGRLECARALLRAGADPDFVNGAGDLAVFWAVDGGAEMIQLFARSGADLDKESPKVCVCVLFGRGLVRACLALCHAHHNAGSNGRPAQLLPAESPLTHPPTQHRARAAGLDRAVLRARQGQVWADRGGRRLECRLEVWHSGCWSCRAVPPPIRSATVAAACCRDDISREKRERNCLFTTLVCDRKGSAAAFFASFSPPNVSALKDSKKKLMSPGRRRARSRQKRRAYALSRRRNGTSLGRARGRAQNRRTRREKRTRRERQHTKGETHKEE